MWKDVIEDDMPAIMEPISTASETGEEVLKKSRHIFDDNDDENTFDTANPIKSFNKMIHNNKEDLVTIATKEMSNYIYMKSENIVGEEALLHLVECVRALRSSCREQQEQTYWDNWLMAARSTLSPTLFQRIVKEGLLYFKGDNKEFLLPEKPSVPIVTDVEFDELD